MEGPIIRTINRIRSSFGLPRGRFLKTRVMTRGPMRKRSDEDEDEDEDQYPPPMDSAPPDYWYRSRRKPAKRSSSKARTRRKPRAKAGTRKRSLHSQKTQATMFGPTVHPEIGKHIDISYPAGAKKSVAWLNKEWNKAKRSGNRERMKLLKSSAVLAANRAGVGADNPHISSPQQKEYRQCQNIYKKWYKSKKLPE